MKKTKLVDRVIVPPNIDETQIITPGDGSFEKPREVIPRLKSLLLLLEKGFDIDVKSDEEVEITTGVIRPNMMRSTSYRVVEIFGLGRIVLVCDEVGNTTYVFDAEVCKGYGIDTEYLAKQDKISLDSLLHDDGKIGRRINYSKKYIDHLSDALSQLPNNENEAQVSILKPKETVDYIPESYKTVLEVAQELNRSPETIYQRIKRLDPDIFGIILYYKERHEPGTAKRLLSPDQQELLLATNGTRSVLDSIPDGYVTYEYMANELKLTYAGLVSAIKAIGQDKLGEVLKCCNVNHLQQLVISPKQQRILRDRYVSVLDYIPQGYVLFSDMVIDLKSSGSYLNQRIKRIGVEDFGAIVRYREPGVSGSGFRILSPSQQAVLHSNAGKIHNLEIDELVDYIPDGCVPWKEMANELCLALKGGLKERIAYINKAQFGPILRYKEPGKKGSAERLLTPEQQALIREYDRSYQIPDGYTTFKAMCNELNISAGGLTKRVSKYSTEDFGPVKRLHGSKETDYNMRLLSLDQQKILRVQDASIKIKLGKRATSSTKNND